jgi:hypothetical protein
MLAFNLEHNAILLVSDNIDKIIGCCFQVKKMLMIADM